MAESVNLGEWYNPTQAVERLTQNSGKPVHKNYPRLLFCYGKVRSILVAPNVRLYRKEDIDGYQVGTRGRPVKESA